MLFVFLCGMMLANLAIGFGLAFYLRQLVVDDRAIVALQSEMEGTEVDVDRELSCDSANAPEQMTVRARAIASIDAIPPEYVDMLKGESVVANSLVEASAEVLRLEVGRYRDALIEIDNQMRDMDEYPDDGLLEVITVELEDLNREWLNKQADAAGTLDGNSDSLGEYSDIGSSLNMVLMEQAAQIETTISNIEQLDLTSDTSDARRRLMQEVGRLIDLAHDLRDKMQDTMLTILRAERRLGEVDRKMQFDGLTKLHNRNGLEVVFFEWWRADIRRERIVSVALLDIDNLRKINDRFGALAGDRLLAEFGRLLGELIRKDRGFDIVCRSTGQQFVIFFGDTGPRNATSSVERIRQTLEATSFDLDGEAVEMEVSIGVTEVDAADTTTKVMKRLEKAMRVAKRNGRNCTVIDEGNGPTPITPPEYRVNGRTITVEER
ncbi:GGDEF domain-containing protein [Blastopirellula retiformator]|uniref:diguanylate cyclase n=1 Tax=Blastopirellula retiformator TaxID=2527970 RepID=A0A5C5V222_9BACT|nr:GGDEF domain-containing protein [Blastopirellula retiformator]TWT31762.1 Response regulator PleD [Blastopirellula retiformator]